MEDYSTMVATRIVGCSRSVFDELDSAIQTERRRLDEFGIKLCLQAKYFDGQGVFLFAEEGFSDYDLSTDTCSAISRLLKSVGQKYLEFTCAVTCSQVMAASHWGESFRIYADGRVVWPDLKWPGE